VDIEWINRVSFLLARYIEETPAQRHSPYGGRLFRCGPEAAEFGVKGYSRRNGIDEDDPMEKQYDFFSSLRGLAGHWKALVALAAAVAVAAIYFERKLFSSSAPPPAASTAEAQSPAAPPVSPEAPKEAPAAAPTAGEAQKPAEGEKQTAAPPEATTDAPTDSVTSQMVDVPARPVAMLRGEAKWDDATIALVEATAKINAALTKAGLAAGGRPLTVFTETNENGFHYEAMIPIAKAPEGKAKLADGVEIGSSPTGKALKFQHRGTYEEIDSTYEAITAYLDEKGLDTKNQFIEEYLTDLKPEDDGAVDVDVYVFVK
jgi:effector-binding domain-containing protein